MYFIGSNYSFLAQLFEKNWTDLQVKFSQVHQLSNFRQQGIHGQNLTSAYALLHKEPTTHPSFQRYTPLTRIQESTVRVTSSVVSPKHPNQAHNLCSHLVLFKALYQLYNGLNVVTSKTFCQATVWHMRQHSQYLA